MNFIFFDDASRPQLLPFTHTRPIADIRCGIFTMRERWEHCLLAAGLAHGTPHHSPAHTPLVTGSFTEEYLQTVYPMHAGTDNIFINGSVFGTPALAAALLNLQHGQALVKGYQIIAARLNTAKGSLPDFLQQLQSLPAQYVESEIHTIKNVWDIFSSCDRAIRDDFQLLTANKKSAPIPAGVTVAAPENLFIEEGAIINAGCIINAATGPVYVAKGAEVLEGVLVRGPLSLGSHSVVKMGAKLYGATTIGPGCKVGGEINNAVFFANSNKSHDGYIGNAVIGEWCNLGADTNCSNLKNNYADVKIWSEALNRSVPTGLTFCGLMMGDHSKCGINTMFNTGTVVGVSCNIFGSGFPDRFVPSYTWGGAESSRTYNFTQAMETASRMMARRSKTLSPAETAMYQYIFDNRRAPKEAI